MLKIENIISKRCDINDINFIQIGSNDGVKSDPLHELICKYKWKGILVEPQPDVFEQLKKNYHGLIGLIFENVAIHRSKKIVTMFRYIKDSRTTSVISKNRTLGKRKSSEIVEIEVAAVTLDEIIKKHNYEKIDLLQIDAEGYDFEVIKSISLSKYTPTFIQYEEIALRKKNRYLKCIKYLKKKGYCGFIRIGKRDRLAIFKKH